MRNVAGSPVPRVLFSPLWPGDYGFGGEVHALGALGAQPAGQGLGVGRRRLLQGLEPQFQGQHESLFSQMLATSVLFAVDVLFYLFLYS